MCVFLHHYDTITVLYPMYAYNVCDCAFFSATLCPIPVPGRPTSKILLTMLQILKNSHTVKHY